MSAYFQRAEAVAQSDGNLFEPSQDAAVVEGGLRSAKQRTAAGAIAGSAAAAIGALALKRQNDRRAEFRRV
jgi:hypothetical protein